MKTLLLTGCANLLIWTSLLAQTSPQALPVLSHQNWKYNDSGTDLGTAWRSATYDDNAWASDTTRITYGESDDLGPVRLTTTTYFRKKISVDDIAKYASFKLRVKFDDAVVVYFNGVEVYRNNLTGVVNYQTTATVIEPLEREWKEFTVPVSSLQTGVNQLAVEVHQHPNNAHDMTFDLELKGNLCVTCPPPGTPLPILSHQSWKYNDSGTDLGTAWRSATYDDNAWASDTTRITYGESDDLGPVRLTTTTYFRKKVTVDNVANYQSFLLRVKFDDGVVVYANGAEVYRNNLAGTVNYNTPATVIEPLEREWKQVTLPASILQSGVNQIAVEVHQHPNNAHDMTFDLELKGVVGPQPPLANITRGPYLQMGTSTAMTVRWRTALPTKGQVHFGTQLGSLASVVTETVSSTEHSVRLTSLLPETKYFYSIEKAEPFAVLEASAEHFFTTAPLPGSTKKTRIWVLGDHGNSLPTVTASRQDSVITAFKNFSQQAATGPMDLWLWLGDNAYDNGTDEEYQQKVFDKTRSRYDWTFRQTPFYGTPGNHDYYFPDGVVNKSNRSNHNVHYYSVVDNFKNAEAGGEPSGKEEYYSFDYANIHFVSLDTWGVEAGYANDNFASILAPGSRQQTWLRADLTKAQADPKIHWIVVFTHMPPYTGGTHNSDTEADLISIRANLVPILDEFKVDLVLTAHSHNYERSRLMRDHTGNSGTFSLSTHNPAIGSNAQGSGRYDGSLNSCFYYKNSKTKTGDGKIYNEGIVYAVSGAGGRDGEYTLKNKPLVEKLMQSATTTGGSMYIEVNGKRLDVKYIGTSNNGTGYQVMDQFTMFKDLEGFTVPATDLMTRTAKCECTEAPGASGFTHYTDGKGNLLLSIKKNGNNIGTVGVAPFELKLQGTPGATMINANYPTNYVRPIPNVSGAPWRIFNRYWTMKPGTELTGDNQVIVRQYYKNADLAAMNAPYANALIGHLNLKVFKVNEGTTAYNLAPAGGHATIPQATAYNTQGAWVYDAKTDSPTSYPTLTWWKYQSIGDTIHYGESIAGRLRGGGGIGAPTDLKTNPTGKQEKVQGPWEYLANLTPTIDWKVATSTPSTAWVRGYPPFGYSPNGEDGELTIIPNGCLGNTNCATKSITTYFRGYANPGVGGYFKSFILNYRRDDGVIIYINGKEVTPRDPNMPQESRIIYDTTKAFNANNETEWKTIIIPDDGKYIKAGVNVIAVEVHQASAGSSDMHFNMELVGSPDVAPLSTSARVAVYKPEGVTENTTVSMYPNPTASHVSFSPALEYQSLQLTDVQGRVRRYITQPGTMQELDLSYLPTGIYFLVSQNGDKITRFKIVKQ